MASKGFLFPLVIRKNFCLCSSPTIQRRISFNTLKESLLSLFFCTLGFPSSSVCAAWFNCLLDLRCSHLCSPNPAYLKQSVRNGSFKTVAHVLKNPHHFRGWWLVDHIYHCFCGIQTTSWKYKLEGHHKLITHIIHSCTDQTLVISFCSLNLLFWSKGDWIWVHSLLQLKQWVIPVYEEEKDPIISTCVCTLQHF